MNPTPRGIVAERSYSYLALESVALKFRADHGSPDPTTAINGLHLYDLIQESHVKVKRENRRIYCRVDQLSEGLEAKAMFNPETRDYDIVLSEETYGCLESGNPRGKSSLIHECSHIVLHPNLLEQLSSLPFHSRAALYRGTNIPHEFHIDTEWQADALTSAITMPARGIAALEQSSDKGIWKLFKVSLIAAHFKVSEKAAGYRWENYQKRGTQLLRA